MRSEKQYYVEEIGRHLDKSDYCFLTDYSRLTVAETEDLRGQLGKQDAEFHVIKNRIFALAAKERELPEMPQWLEGQTAIVVGGENVGEVVRILEKFYKDKDKVQIKGGVLAKSLVEPDDVSRLKDLPTKEQLQAQLLGLLVMPARQLLAVFEAVPRDMLGVLGAVPRDLLSVLQQRSQQED